MSLIRIGLVLSALCLASCGGGGGGGGGSDGGGAPPGSTISGFVEKGPTRDAVVQLHALASNGQATLLGQTTSQADGSYAFTVQPPGNAVLLVTASGGTYRDEATGATMTLSSPLRAVTTWSGAAQRISPTPYSEISVRSIERASPADWSPASVQAANGRLTAWLGVTDLLNFRPVDLQANVDPAGLTEQDFSLSLYAGTFSAFARRLDGNAATSLGNALEGLYRLVVVDGSDDRLYPAFLGGLIDFIDLTTLDANTKRATKSLLLLGSSTPLPDDQLLKFVPHGTASGEASAPMPDDAFRILGAPTGHTVFNKRGALIGFTSSADTPDWSLLYTGSVAELYGDGEVGIGRWNGGAIVSAVRTGDQWVPRSTALPYDSLHYAVAAAPTSVPVCGLRRLALVSATQPSLSSESAGLPASMTGITPDSTLAIEYLGNTAYLGADIGVKAVDGSVVRFRSPGGLATPWAGAQIPAGIGLLPVEPAGVLANQTLSLSALAGGVGARKVVVRLDLGASNSPDEMTAVFAGPAGDPDPAGCPSVGAPGPGIQPRPVDGNANVFMRIGAEDFFRGAEVPAVFGPSGDIASFIGGPSIAPGTAYDLAGNADASIGRVVAGGREWDGSPVSRTTAYAVARPGAALPATGAVYYDLLASTVTVNRGGTGSELPTGSVGGATLLVIHGEYPVGTSSSLYGSALLRVNGAVDGLPFAIDDVTAPSPNAGARMIYAAFMDSRYSGGLAAPDGEYAVVNFHASVAGGVPVDGALLLRRRP